MKKSDARFSSSFSCFCQGRLLFFPPKRKHNSHLRSGNSPQYAGNCHALRHRPDRTFGRGLRPLRSLRKTLQPHAAGKRNLPAEPRRDQRGFLETSELIQIGLSYGELSEGAFDISIEPVSSLWDFTSGDAVIPDEKELAEAVALVDYRKVHVNGNTVTFDTPGMGLDLGAIAKGYIADRIKEYLKKEGVEHALINLGGNILCLGDKPEGTAFRIGVQKPFGEATETLTICPIEDQSLVSSGTYERFFRKDGRIYHHILNPKTGYPYDNGLTAVTIRSDDSLTGDALSTTVFALGEEKGWSF
ncbi:MAG: FAD:protein FMN transferase [Lachnospiraceae bacterium]